MDSVKEIGLSNGDIIKLSKNYGLLQFPGAGSDTYNLKGIEGVNPIGEQTLSSHDIYDFQVGDVLQYRSSVFNASEPSNDVTISKYEVTSVDVYDDSVIIGTQGHYHSYDYMAMSPEVWGVIQGIRIYRKNESDLYNYYSNELVFIEEVNQLFVDNFLGFKFGKCVYGIENERRFIGLGTYEFNPNFDEVGLYLGVEGESDSLKLTPNAQLNQYSLSELYVEGLGRTEWKIGVFEYYMEESLMGYVKNEDTVGIIYDDNHFVSIEDLESSIKPKKIVRIVDVLGRESEQQPNVPLFYIYNDGTVEKRFVVE